MEYITVQEAAGKWGVTMRQVENQCAMGRIPGVIRFNRCWAIPEDAQKPADRRSQTSAEEDGMLRTPDPAWEKECTLSQFAMFFPWPMQVMTSDGTLFLINDAFKKLFKISDAAEKKLIGKYNLLKHPMIRKWGLMDDVSRLFQGESVVWKDMKVPLREISEVFGEGELTTETIYQDILAFSIYDDSSRMRFAVIIYITSRLYNGREEIAKGKEYLENHWLMKFDLDATARASGLSRGHFEKLFKTYTGFTPHQYYLDIKIRMLQKKLIDSNLSVLQAFEECGMEYNSYYTGIFKASTGMSPTEYRKRASGH